MQYLLVWGAPLPLASFQFHNWFLGAIVFQKSKNWISKQSPPENCVNFEYIAFPVQFKGAEIFTKQKGLAKISLIWTPTYFERYSKKIYIGILFVRWGNCGIFSVTFGVCFANISALQNYTEKVLESKFSHGSQFLRAKKSFEFCFLVLEISS